MKNQYLFLAVIILLSVFSPFPEAPRAGEAGISGKEKEVVEGNNRFALSLYGQLRKQSGNLFFSPLSISTALAMTYAGARGDTEKEMARALHFTLEQDSLHPVFAELLNGLQSLNREKDCQLALANRLWGQKGYSFLESFRKITRVYYGAELVQLDFKSFAPVARRIINNWVEEKTRGKIKELIAPGVLNALTRLVLTNAVYFKGSWASEFAEGKTEPAPFTLSSGEKIEVPLMTQSEDFRYYEEKNFQVLELPYAGNKLSMVVFLPRKADGLKELEDWFNRENLKECWQGLSRKKVAVFLPRFTLESKFQLGKVLSAMGMPRAFTPAADFSGMTGKMDLFISAVIHQAFVNVNEEGTEAAAATAVVMGLTALAPAKAVTFRADHPFIFLIRDRSSESILFLGRLLNPGP